MAAKKSQKPAGSKPVTKPKKASKTASKKSSKKAASRKTSHAALLVAHLESGAPKLPRAALRKGEPKVPPILEIAAADPAVEALVETLVRRGTYFAIFDIEISAGSLLRGRESRNAGKQIVGERDVPIAKNGAGDLFVWNADDGSVRFVVHDEDWAEKRKYRSVESFLEEEMYRALENVQPDDLEDLDDAYRANLALAIRIAGEDALDDEAREKLEELGVIGGG
jgi:hypothetical protein